MKIWDISAKKCNFSRFYKRRWFKAPKWLILPGLVVRIEPSKTDGDIGIWAKCDEDISWHLKYKVEEWVEREREGRGKCSEQRKEFGEKAVKWGTRLYWEQLWGISYSSCLLSNQRRTGIWYTLAIEPPLVFSKSMNIDNPVMLYW